MDPSLDICSGIFRHPGKDRTISVRRTQKMGRMHHCCPAKRVRNMVQFPQDTPHPCADAFLQMPRRHHEYGLNSFYFMASYMFTSGSIPSGVNLAEEQERHTIGFTGHAAIKFTATTRGQAEL
jgi:hypothetical protein